MDYEEYDLLEEAEASDQVVWDQNSLDRLEREWEPKELLFYERQKEIIRQIEDFDL